MPTEVHFFVTLREYARSIFTCGTDSIHGPAHWDRVDAAARLICRDTAADLAVVRFFAFLHDASREDDGADLEHGPRAVERLAELPGELDVLGPFRKRLLCEAMLRHTDGDVSDDPTIGACWDADRLDLGRAGIIPRERFMSTGPGREMARLGGSLLYMQERGISPSYHHRTV